MKLIKSITAESVLAMSMFASGNSYADNITVDMAIAPTPGIGTFVGTGTLLDGGNDVVTFTNLATGTYNFIFSMSSNSLNITSVFVNALNASSANNGTPVLGTDATPFVITINGTINPDTGFTPGYSGQLSFSQAVPEAGTYLLLLAGLGMVGLAARHRKIAWFSKENL